MQEIIVALVGQPNVGKSSLINSISGAHLKVGNFTGVTVEKAQASLIYKDFKLTIIDLPGTYSLNDFTLEEKVTKDFLENGAYDIILNVIDATNLERNLALTAQILEMGKKTLVSLNMWDEAQKEKISIDQKLLCENLGISCICTSAKTNLNTQTMLDEIIKLFQAKNVSSKRIYGDIIESQICFLSKFLDQKSYHEISALQAQKFLDCRQIAIMLLSQKSSFFAYLHGKSCWYEISSILEESFENLRKKFKENSIQNIFISDALNFAKKTSQEVISRPKQPFNKSQRIDSILLNRYFGLPIFLFFMFIVFYISFLVGGTLQGYLEDSFSQFGEFVKTFMNNKDFASLISDGIIGGVGTVISFLPLIVILYFGISLLEATGYMSRAAFLLDGVFHKFGLHGKSFVPIVTGFGCSVPAYMATRTLQNKNERLITLFIIGFMSCSARLPIYVLFVGSFFPDKYAGAILFLIYFFGSLIALFIAKLLRLSIFKGKNEPFVMEMPKYRMPSWKIIWFGIYTKVLMFLKKAGGFLMIGSMLIWFASQYPKNPALEAVYQDKITAVEESLIASEEKEQITSDLQNELEELLLRSSYLGRIGLFLQPIFLPMDFDWRLPISLITGVAAKEVVVSTLGVLYSLGNSQDENSQGFRDVLQKNVSIPSAVAFIIIIMFYIPCFAATIVFGKEAGGNRFVVYLFVLTSLISYAFALVGFYITKYLMLLF